MAIFNRKKQPTTGIPEVERYYDAERRERSGMAWILALVSVAGVALLLIGLFFGGRYLYRKVTNDKKPAITAQVQSTPDEKENSSNQKGTSSTSTTTPSVTATPAVTPPTPPTSSQTQSGTLANTGPESLIPIFLVTTIAGTLVYQAKQRKISLL